MPLSSSCRRAPTAAGITADTASTPAIASLFTHPKIIDPINPLRLYIGTNRLYQTLIGGGVWTLVSDDLTDSRGVITTIAVSPVSNKVVWTGSSNAKVFVTQSE